MKQVHFRYHVQKPERRVLFLLGRWQPGQAKNLASRGFFALSLLRFPGRLGNIILVFKILPKNAVGINL